MTESESMEVRILFFGATADAARTRTTDLRLSHGATAAEAFQRVLESYPELSSHKLLFSVNQTYATGSEVLNANDELAVFTAVSGG